MCVCVCVCEKERGTDSGDQSHDTRSRRRPWHPVDLPPELDGRCRPPDRKQPTDDLARKKHIYRTSKSVGLETEVNEAREGDEEEGCGWEDGEDAGGRD